LKNRPAPVFAGKSYSFEVDNGMELRDQYGRDGRLHVVEGASVPVSR
jgi:hypothetical protein